MLYLLAVVTKQFHLPNWQEFSISLRAVSLVSLIFIEFQNCLYNARQASDTAG